MSVNLCGKLCEKLFFSYFLWFEGTFPVLSHFLKGPHLKSRISERISERFPVVRGEKDATLIVAPHRPKFYHPDTLRDLQQHCARSNSGTKSSLRPSSDSGLLS